MAIDPITAATIQTGLSTVKSGAKLAVRFANQTRDYLDSAYGDLPERCKPQGADFSNIQTMPVRIAQKIDLCKKIADTVGMPEIKASLNEIIEQVSSPLYKIFILGRYSTGKSSILNAVLNMNVLPTGMLPTTKTLTWIMAGDKDAVVCEKQNGELLNLTPSALNDEKNESDIDLSRNIMLLLNNKLLKSGVAIIDTPGLGDTDGAAVAITREAIESADALLFVVDQYMSSKEKELLSELVRKRKTDHLFVIINKMDLVPENERSRFIKEKIAVLNELGIGANIFPISATDTRMKQQIEDLRSALGRFMLTDIERSRSSIVEGRVDALVDVVHERCENMREAQKLSANEQYDVYGKISHNLQVHEEQKYSAIMKADHIVDDVESTMIFNWQSFFRSLRSEVDCMIDHASVDNMKRPDFIESTVLRKVFEFLEHEIQDAFVSLGDSVEKECETHLSPAIYDSFNLGAVRSTGLSSIPPKLMSSGLILYNFSVSGILAGTKTLIFASFAAPLLEGFLAAAANFADTTIMRNKLRRTLDEHYPLLDKQIRAKIREICASFKKQISANIDKRFALSAEGGNTIMGMLAQSKQNQIEPAKIEEWIAATNRR